MADDVGSALTGLGNWLGLTRPSESFSAEDEKFRNEMIRLAFRQGQLAKLDRTQKQLWKDDWDRQVIPGLNTNMRHRNWRKNCSNMP